MEEKKKKSTGLIIMIIILILVILGLIGFILYDKDIINFKSEEKKTTIQKTDKKEEKEEKEDNSTDSSVSNVVSKCFGTYYGEYIDSNYNIKVTYILKEDGTYTADYVSSGEEGFFAIHDNTISLTHNKHVTGPREEDPYYNTDDYVMADDCSYFIINDGSGISYKVNKQ